MVNVGAVEIPSPHPLMGLAGLLASSRADLSALSRIITAAQVSRLR